MIKNFNRCPVEDTECPYYEENGYCALAHPVEDCETFALYSLESEDN
jgi:hypothetical protein